MEIPFSQKEIKDCICTACPVQMRSACAKDKEKTSKSSPQPKPHETPRLYCSSGKASCPDLDTKQMCICGACPVWHRYKLSAAKPTLYFCRDGSSK